MEISVKAFRDRIRREVTAICEEESLSYEVAPDRGRAFEIWCARQLAEYERGIDTDPDTGIVGGPNDLRIDLFLRNESEKRTLICQCKFLTGKNQRVQEEDVDAFFALRNDLRNPDWVREHASTLLRDVMGDPTRLFKHPETVTFRFITTGRFSDRIRTKFRSLAQDGGGPICELWDISQLKEFIERGRSIDRSIPPEVRIDLPQGKWMRVDPPAGEKQRGAGLVAILKTNSIADLYDQHKEAIYAYNIRRNLTKSDINRNMEQTMSDDAGAFFYYNNGVSAICTDFRIDDGDHLIASDFQIINGTQTLHAIWTSKRNSDGRVLFRLTRGESVKTERGFNADIIRFNNTQNVVKDSDFRSNDEIQKWIEDEFADRRWPYQALPRLRYVRKRGGRERAKKGQVSVTLEELAKIRYAWLEEPMTIARRPKDLFSRDPDTGLYGLAFGVSGDVCAEWPPSVKEEALLAVWFYLELNQWAKALRKTRRDAGQPPVNWLTGHRWHLLAVAGVLARESKWDPSDLLRERKRCEDAFWDNFIEDAWAAVERAEIKRADEKRQSWRDWRQSEREWRDLRDAVLSETRRDANMVSVRSRVIGR